MSAGSLEQSELRERNRGRAGTEEESCVRERGIRERRGDLGFAIGMVEIRY